MNVTERLKRLEFRLHPKLTVNGAKVYTRDVPLARGYKHEYSKRPASFCRIQAVHAPDDAVHVSFTFGWFRRTLNRQGIRHVLIITPDGEYDQRRSMNEHAEVEEFEKEMTDLIRVLHSHSFESIQELYDFMASWTNKLSSPFGWNLSAKRDASRVERAFAVINKEETPAVERVPKSGLTRYRMGRPLVRQGSVRYRGR
jgi:hypothetical protein